MILRRLEVKGWRCFGDQLSLGPFADGISLVSGPNGAGKSSLFWAMARGLFDRHGTGGKELERVRTWERDLAPEVAVDFEVGGQAWRIEKTFLSGAASRLYRLENGAATLYAEAEAADDHLRQLLGFKGALRGLSKPEHWGLAQLLWAPQGALEVPELGSEVLGVIQQSLGVQLAAGSPIGGAVEKEFLRYYSPKGRELRGDRAPAVAALRAEMEELKERHAELDRSLLDFEVLQKSLEDNRAGLEQLRRDAERETEDLEKAEAGVSEYKALDGEVRLEETSAAEAGARFTALDERDKQMMKLRERIDATERRIPALLEGRDISSEADEAAKGVEEAAAESLRTVRSKSEDVQALQARAAAARELGDSSREANDAADRLKRHQDLAAGLEARRAERNDLLAPTNEELDAIRNLGERILETRVRLEAALITLELVPEQDIEAEVLVGDDPGALALKKGAPELLRGAPVVEVRVEGFGRIRARGPMGDVAILRQTLAEQNGDLVQRTRGYGTDDVEELQRRAARAARLDDAIEAAESADRELLGDETPDDLTRALATHRERNRSIFGAFPEWVDAPPDAADEEVRRVQECWLQEVAGAEQALDLARLERSAAKEELVAAAAALAAAEAELVVVRDELAELRRVDGHEDEERRRLRDQAAMEHRAAAARAAGARDRLDAFGGDPTRARDQLREKVRRNDERLRKLELEAGGLRVKLTGMVGSRSPQRELALTEEAIAGVETRCAGEERQMAAARLLYDLFREEEQAVMDSLAAPVEREAGEILCRIAGPRLGDLVLADGLRPSGVRPRAVRDDVEPGIEDLSTGEQEQVHFAVRLALARILAGDERRLVVLDDILAHTDRVRYGHVIQILRELSERLQIVVLTCHPERYDSLDVTEFPLVAG